MKTTHRPKITQDELRYVLDYDPISGVFTWKNTAPHHMAGLQAGYTQWMPREYRWFFTKIRVNGRVYLASHLAWLYMYGRWPEFEIEHINGLREDDAFDNLRESTRSRIRRTQKKNRINRSGRQGVTWEASKQKWVAWKIVERTRLFLGRYDLIEDAAEARAMADLIYDYFEWFDGPHKNNIIRFQSLIDGKGLNLCQERDRLLER